MAALAELAGPPGSGRLSDSAERALSIAVVLMAVVTVPLTVLEEGGQTGVEIEIANWLVWSVFAVDFLVHGALASNYRSYMRRNWLGAAIVVLSFPLAPNLLALVRLARLTRLLRLLRLVAIVSKALENLRPAIGRPGLLYVFLMTILVVFAGGGALAVLEPDTVKGSFWTGMWWSVVTVTTVGYGDVTPVTPEGRVLAVLLMLTGLGLVSTLSASIAAYFVRSDTLHDDSEIKAMRRQLDEMHLLLRKIESERTVNERE